MKNLIILLAACSLLACGKEEIDPPTSSDSSIIGTWRHDSTYQDNYVDDKYLATHGVPCSLCDSAFYGRFVFEFSAESVVSWNRSPDMSVNISHGRRSYEYDGESSLTIDKTTPAALRWYDIEILSNSGDTMIWKDLNPSVDETWPEGVLKQYDVYIMVKQ